MTTLREAAQQALDSINELFAAEQSEGGERGGHVRTPATREHLVRVAQARKALHESCDTLRAALEQQAEPVQDQRCRAEPRSDGDFVCDCKIGECPRRSAALAQEPVACNNTFACQCSKHFASQQSEQRPKRVLTAVWRDRAQRAEAQRDALLEALKAAEPYLRHADVDYNVYVQCRAAIKAVEEGK